MLEDCRRGDPESMIGYASQELRRSQREVGLDPEEQKYRAVDCIGGAW